MSKLNTSMHTNTAKALGVYQAATLDGYWEDAALKDLQYMFLLGQLQATESIHTSRGNNATRLRIKRLKAELEALDVRLEMPTDE